jgi:hypothetical protein
MTRRQLVALCLAAAIGIGVSLAFVPAMALMAAIPVIVSVQASRRSAFLSAFAYYFATCWPLVTAAKYFFGPHDSAVFILMLWIVAACVLAAPCGLAWTTNRGQLFWRIPLGLTASAVPPLAVIGWASPLTCAGLLFPGTSWLGLVAVTLWPAWLIHSPRRATSALLAAVAAANGVSPNIPGAPAGWEAIDTRFNSGPPTMTEFATVTWLQGRAVQSKGKVIVFPETVVPMWTEATELYWQEALDELRASGKTILVGAGMPRQDSALPTTQFDQVLSVLRDGRMPVAGPAADPADLPYLNTLLVRGAETGSYLQRIPVPLGMWKSFSRTGVPLNLFGPATVEIHGHRVAPLLCYETLLVWPVLHSMLRQPRTIVAVANDHWAVGDTIPRFQRTAVALWARLFRVHHVVATNR